jgi:hypothetical protein
MTLDVTPAFFKGNYATVILLVRYVPIANEMVLAVLTKPRSPNHLSTPRTTIDTAKYRPLNALNRTLPVDSAMRKVVPASAMAPKEDLVIATRVTMLARLHFAVISTLPTPLLRTKRILVLEENTPFYTTRNAIGV